MTCRYDNVDPTRCDRCGALLWLAEEGAFCGDCGITMPCTMRVRPLAPGPSDPATPIHGRARISDAASTAPR